MKKLIYVSVIVILTCIYLPSASAIPSMAFGYLHNKSGDQNFEYLETIFPNSFANSIKNTFNVRVVKPFQVNKRLEKYKIKLQTSYSTYELPDVADKINASFFIYGNFTPLPNDRIRIVLYLYQKGSNRIFSFSNIGKMETEIFKLVDRITMVLINFLARNNLYRSVIIPPKTRLAILTNVEGLDLNILYHSFLKKGYGVASVQDNTLYNYMDKKMIKSFQYMTSSYSSYDIITDKRKIIFPYGTWAGDRHVKLVNHLKKMYKYYDLDYLNTKKSKLRELRTRYKNSFDTLLIIGFSKDRKKAWVRCYDLKEDDVIWMQKNITGANLKKVCEKMIAEMNAKIKGPFDK